MSKIIAKILTSCNKTAGYSNRFIFSPFSGFISFTRPIHVSLKSSEKADVNIVLMRKNGKLQNVVGKEGDSILDVIVNNKIEIKGFGACEGTVSCSTCHVMFSPEDFKNLHTMSVEEEDVLDMAEDVTPSSRLGCQVVLSKSIDGLKVKIPDKIKDIRHADEEVASKE